MAAEVLELPSQTGPRIDEATRAGSWGNAGGDRVRRGSDSIRSMHAPGYLCSETHKRGPCVPRHAGRSSAYCALL